MVNASPPKVRSAPSARPANVPTTASLPSLLTIVNWSPITDWKLADASSTLPPRSTLPVTFSCLYPVPAVVPLRSITNDVVGLSTTLPLFKIPGAEALPGSIIPPVALIAPTRPVPLRVPPLKATLLFGCEPETISLPATMLVVPL